MGESMVVNTRKKAKACAHMLVCLATCAILMFSVGCRSNLKKDQEEAAHALKKESVEKKRALDEMNAEWQVKEPDHVAMARIMVSRKLYDVALRLLREADEPDRAELFYLEGVCYREKGLHEPAIDRFRKALVVSARYSQAYEGIALTYDLMRKGEEASRYYEKAVEENPSNPRYYNNFGVSLLARGRYEEAAVQLEKCVEMDPAFLRAFNNLGLSYGLAGKEQDALLAFMKAGDAASAYRNMAFMYGVRGEKNRSREMDRKALALSQNPKNMSATAP